MKSTIDLLIELKHNEQLGVPVMRDNEPTPELPTFSGKNFQVDIERMETLRPFIKQANGWANFLGIVSSCFKTRQ